MSNIIHHWKLEESRFGVPVWRNLATGEKSVDPPPGYENQEPVSFAEFFGDAEWDEFAERWRYLNKQIPGAQKTRDGSKYPWKIQVGSTPDKVQQANQKPSLTADQAHAKFQSMVGKKLSASEAKGLHKELASMDRKQLLAMQQKLGIKGGRTQEEKAKSIHKQAISPSLDLVKRHINGLLNDKDKADPTNAISSVIDRMGFKDQSKLAKSLGIDGIDSDEMAKKIVENHRGKQEQPKAEEPKPEEAKPAEEKPQEEAPKPEPEKSPLGQDVEKQFSAIEPGSENKVTIYGAEITRGEFDTDVYTAHYDGKTRVDTGDGMRKWLAERASSDTTGQKDEAKSTENVENREAESDNRTPSDTAPQEEHPKEEPKPAEEDRMDAIPVDEEENWLTKKEEPKKESLGWPFDPDAEKPAHVRQAEVDHYHKIGDEALSKAYGYAPAPKGNFGHVANQESAKAALDLIDKGETDIEKIASAVHDGWAKAAKDWASGDESSKEYQDKFNATPFSKADPKKQKSRADQASKSYDQLSEEEKQIDRVAARAYLKEHMGESYWGNAKSQPYWRPGANPTVDNVYTRGEGDDKQVLLIKRGKGAEAGKWALPGGFHDTESAKGEAWKEGHESSKWAAIREAAEETGILNKDDVNKLKPHLDGKENVDVNEVAQKTGVDPKAIQQTMDLAKGLNHVGEYEGNKRDPRDNDESWSKSNAYHMHFGNDNELAKNAVQGMSDAENAEWVPVKDLKNRQLAFDHGKILNDALDKHENSKHPDYELSKEDSKFRDTPLTDHSVHDWKQVKDKMNSNELHGSEAKRWQSHWQEMADKYRESNPAKAKMAQENYDKLESYERSPAQGETEKLKGSLSQDQLHSIRTAPKHLKDPIIKMHNMINDGFNPNLHEAEHLVPIKIKAALSKLSPEEQKEIAKRVTGRSLTPEDKPKDIIAEPIIRRWISERMRQGIKGGVAFEDIPQRPTSGKGKASKAKGPSETVKQNSIKNYENLLNMKPQDGENEEQHAKKLEQLFDNQFKKTMTKPVLEQIAKSQGLETEGRTGPELRRDLLNNLHPNINASIPERAKRVRKPKQLSNLDKGQSQSTPPAENKPVETNVKPKPTKQAKPKQPKNNASGQDVSRKAQKPLVKKAPANQGDLINEISRESQQKDLNDHMGAGRGVNIKDIGIDEATAAKFDGHGTDLKGLANILNGGINNSKFFHSERLNSAISGGYSLLKDGNPFVVIGHPGQPITSGGVNAVIVDGNHTSSIRNLRKAFPGVKFIPAEIAHGMLSEMARKNPSGEVEYSNKTGI